MIILNISKLLENTLKNQGRSKIWLSEVTGINYKTLTGKFKRDSFEGLELIKISKVLGIDLNELKEEV